jgi:hypothetical protein
MRFLPRAPCCKRKRKERREQMRRFIIALGALAAMAGAGQLARPASAEINYPYCRGVSGGEGSEKRCDFTTLEQCRVTASGLGGTCYPNPLYSGSSSVNASYRGHARYLH